MKETLELLTKIKSGIGEGVSQVRVITRDYGGGGLSISVDWFDGHSVEVPYTLGEILSTNNTEALVDNLIETVLYEKRRAERQQKLR